MEEHDTLLSAVTALTNYFVGDASMLETLQRVSELARSAVRVSNQVGITLVIDGQPGTYVFTDDEISIVDRSQYETGDGPCLEAYDTGNIVVVPSTRTSERY